MKIRYLIALVAGTAAAVAGLTCAPVDAPPPEDSKPADGPPARAEGPAPAAPRPDGLEQRILAAIEQARERDMRTDTGFWTVFHGILGLGPKTATLLDPMTGKRLNALDYIARGGEVRGMRFVPTPDGLDVETRPGTFIFQGHQDQFVAEMVEWGVPPDKKFRVGGKDYTFDDFLRNSKARASAKKGQELEWALVIIGTRFGTDITWTNADGEEVRFEDLVREELNKPVDKAACGGTHLLFGLTWVYHLHLLHGGQPVGVWKDVEARIAEHKKKAREFQNPDGSFSTEFFRGRGNAPDMQLRMNTTGHIFEWLALALSDEELKEPWVQNAANALSLMFLDIQGQQMEGGTMYHAVHGLLLYYSRVYGADKLGEMKPHALLLPAKKG
jgi:hypothetical protein